VYSGSDHPHVAQQLNALTEFDLDVKFKGNRMTDKDVIKKGVSEALEGDIKRGKLREEFDAIDSRLLAMDKKLALFGAFIYLANGASKTSPTAEEIAEGRKAVREFMNTFG